jgi:hypothetical protein
MFGSKTILGHLARGALGVGTLGFAVSGAAAHPWLALAALPIALVAFRGCPTCWTVGLVQTVVAKLQGKSTEGLCRDGSCALPSRREPAPPPAPGHA